MGQIMLGLMINELGFSDTEYIAVNKLIGFWALIVGSAIGAPFIAWPACRALFASGVLMMISNLLFAALAATGHSNLMLALAVGTENLTSGTLMRSSPTCRACPALPIPATQFALLSSFAAVGRTWLSTPSGYRRKRSGWVGLAVYGRGRRARPDPALDIMAAWICRSNPSASQTEDDEPSPAAAR